jgi:hypothetical protein
MRLPTTEYLTKIKKQATAITFREITPDYYASLGVGIVRETTRRAYKNQPKFFDTIKEAFDDIQKRISISTNLIKEKSQILKDYGKQKPLREFY